MSDKKSERDVGVDAMGLKALTEILRAANIEPLGRNTVQLRDLIKKDLSISLEPAKDYVKQNHPLQKSQKTFEKTVSLEIVPVSETRGTSESSDDIKNSTINTDTENPLMVTFRVPKTNYESTTKRTLWVVIFDDSTFLGAFNSILNLKNALKDRFPDIPLANFQTEDGYKGVRVTNFMGDRLLSPNRDAYREGASHDY